VRADKRRSCARALAQRERHRKPEKCRDGPFSLVFDADGFAVLFCIPRGLSRGSSFPLPRSFLSLSLSLSLSRISVASSFARSSLEAAFRKLKRAYGEATAMASALSSVASRRD